MGKINAFIFSYKNKKLIEIVKALLNSTDSDIFIVVYDQNTIDRSEDFVDIENVEYRYLYWERLEGQFYFQNEFLKHDASAEYLLILGDDVTLPKSWDTDMINFLGDKQAIVSGQGFPKVVYKDLFSFDVERMATKDFEKTQWIDKNFMFAKADRLRPTAEINYLKYYGYDEVCGLYLFANNIDIYSTPSNYYLDSLSRNLEKLYVPFSLEHNYNVMINKLYSDETILAGSFKKIHNISKPLVVLPYQTNDVAYDLQKSSVKMDSSEARMRYTDGPRTL